MKLKKILEFLARGKISVEEAEKLVRLHAVEELEDFAKIDIGRDLRRDVPEIVFAEYKSNFFLEKIIEEVVEKKGKVIVSRIKESQLNIIKKFEQKYDVKIGKECRSAIIRKKNIKTDKTGGKVGIIAAGTADIGIAEEIKMVVEEFGCETLVIYDVGVASLKRTLDAVKKVIEEDVDVVVAVAGMEAALPSIVASFLNVPVIGVPTSRSYGVGGEGEAALLSILQTCVPGVLAVNIDNAIGAAVAAALIANRVARFRGERDEERKNYNS